MADRRAGDPARPLGVAALVAALVALSAVAAPLADARPAHEIPVVADPEGDLAEPGAAGWADVPPADVSLASAPSSVPNADDTTIEVIHVQAATSDGRLFVRLQWTDPTRDVSTDGPRAFADAVAVQFPANRSSRPPIAMGGRDNMVNVWYWSGGAGTQELLAGGAGSTTTFQELTVEANATHEGSGENATWTVVYSRSVDAPGENRTSIGADGNGNGNLDVAFAVWNGSNDERAGQKAVSEWHYFPLGGGPGGPPYETLLWTIAGLAVVAVTAVTAFGVYRARGGME